MKLLNFTSRYFALALLVIIPIWAAIFYYSMLTEIYDSIDDGLDNQKGLIIRKAAADSSLLNKNNFEEADYAIRETNPVVAAKFYDRYSDTMMYMQNERSEEPVRMLTTIFMQNDHYYRLQVITSMVEEDDLIKQLLYSLIWLYAGLVISILILNNYLLRKIWKPFHHLLAQLKKYRLDKPGEVTPAPSRVEEFNMLNDTVRVLLERNREIFNSQKRFIEDASHELQTPLAISINKLETLAELPGLSEEQLKIVSSALDNLERLTRLNKSLLLLSKIENKQFLELSEVNFNELVFKIMNDFKDLSDFYGVQTSIIEEEICLRQMNEDLALIMLSNLVKNAILHNKQNGFVQVIISKEKIEVKNSGADNPLDGNTIFNRFHTGTTSAGSTGIGLALVKAISQVYSFNVTYSFSGDHHMIVNFSPLQ